MKITIVSTTGFATPPVAYGGEVMVHDLAESLVQLGHDVNLVATYSSKVGNGINHVKTATSINNTDMMVGCEYNSTLYNANVFRDSDVVHDFSHEKFASKFCLDENIPCLSTLWGTSFRKPCPSYNVVCWSNAHMNCGLDGRSGYEGTPLNNPWMYSGKLNAAKVVYGGVNTDFYTPPEDERGDYFLYVARPHISKGTDIAINLAIDTGLELKLAWRTASPDHVMFEQKYLEMIKGHDNIEFIELPSDNTHHVVKRDLMNHAKAFLFPVQYLEAFGLVVTEAMSCGTPVIVTGNGAMPEIVNDSKTGFICNTYQSFKNAMRHIDIIDNDVCREHTVTKFDRMISTKNYVELYEKVINGEKW